MDALLVSGIILGSLVAGLIAGWAFGAAGAMDDVGFTSPIDNFYMTDPISRASATMAACTESLSGTVEKTGTDG